jgi:hypothetical protein
MLPPEWDSTQESSWPSNAHVSVLPSRADRSRSELSDDGSRRDVSKPRHMEPDPSCLSPTASPFPPSGLFRYKGASSRTVSRQPQRFHLIAVAKYADGVRIQTSPPSPLPVDADTRQQARGWIKIMCLLMHQETKCKLSSRHDQNDQQAHKQIIEMDRGTRPSPTRAIQDRQSRRHPASQWSASPLRTSRA